MVRKVFSLLATLIAFCAPVAAQTVAPPPVFTALDNTGVAVSGGKLCVYASGTTTPATTYTSSSLAVANSNPVIMNAAGRANVFLQSGQSYKFILRTAGSDSTCATGTILWSQDGVQAIPSSSSNLDILGTVGESITAGQAIYLSDGSGGKIAGEWYLASNVNPYSNTQPLVGMAPNAITSGAIGTLRLSGQISGLSSLTVGSRYYIGTGGSITATAPGNPRLLGSADSTSSLVLTGNPQPTVELDPGLDQFRCTLTSGLAITFADVTAATTVYLTPYHGNRIALYDASGIPTLYVSPEISIAVPGTTSQMYDLFVYPSSGTPTPEALAWTNDTTRATALVSTVAPGVLTKTGDATRRYVCSFRTTGVSGQTEDSLVKRYLYNAYNQVPRSMQKNDTTANWTYTTAAWHQANASAANQLDFILGVSDQDIRAEVLGAAGNTNAGVFMAVGIGLDSTTVVSGQQAFAHAAVSTDAVPLLASYHGMVAVGRHTLTWLEYSVATGTTTFYGFGFSLAQSGITGTIRN